MRHDAITPYGCSSYTKRDHSTNLQVLYCTLTDNSNKSNALPIYRNQWSNVGIKRMAIRTLRSRASNNVMHRLNSSRAGFRRILCLRQSYISVLRRSTFVFGASPLFHVSDALSVGRTRRPRRTGPSPSIWIKRWGVLENEKKLKWIMILFKIIYRKADVIITY